MNLVTDELFINVLFQFLIVTSAVSQEHKYWIKNPYIKITLVP